MEPYARLIGEAGRQGLRSPEIYTGPVETGAVSAVRARSEPSSLPIIEQSEFSVEELLDNVRHSIELNPEAARAAALRLVTLLTARTAAGSAPARGGLAPWQNRKVDRYMREHLEHPLSLDRLARLLPLSVSYFCRAFKESFGTTPHTHLMRLRLEMAQQLMLSTKEPLSQIALACGLADQAHLSKLFRRELGETPSAWRRRNLSDTDLDARSFPSQKADGANVCE